MPGKTPTPRRSTSARLEEQLVKKRQAEHDRLNFWDNNSTYFRCWEFNNTQFSSWTSPEFYSTRYEDFSKKEKLKQKQDKIEERRNKLSRLLQEESDTYEKELKDRSRSRTSVFELTGDDLKNINLGLKLREEAERRREREIQLYHQWRQNQPVLREFERNQHRDFVKKYWLTQCIERKEKEAEEEKQKKEYLEKLKELEREHKEIEERLESERKEKRQDLKRFLEEQMQVLKEKEEEERKLKVEEAEVIKRQKELEDIVHERKLSEDRRRRQELSVFHRKQYQLILKKRALEVEKELAMDQALLDRLTSEEENKKMDDLHKCERLRKEASLAHEAFKTHRELEKLRRRQMDFLFDEEAKKLYEKQEREWKMESEARNKLVNDVIQTVESQIKQKLLTNLKNQSEIVDTREKILKDVESANEELREQTESEKQKSVSWKREIEKQVLEKELANEMKKKKEREEREEELKAKEEEETKLYEELRRMNMLGYQPKFSGRRRLTQF